LWPNQFIKARLLLSLRKNAILVPATAVQRGPKGAFAYVVKDDVASPRPIEVEQLLRDQALITSGLGAGDEVVIEGQNQLKPGAKVHKSKAGGKP
jgi:multidrug efflux system membrane fusion protein